MTASWPIRTVRWHCSSSVQETGLPHYVLQTPTIQQPNTPIITLLQYTTTIPQHYSVTRQQHSISPQLEHAVQQNYDHATTRQHDSAPQGPRPKGSLCCNSRCGSQVSKADVLADIASVTEEMSLLPTVGAFLPLSLTLRLFAAATSHCAFDLEVPCVWVAPSTIGWVWFSGRHAWSPARGRCPVIMLTVASYYGIQAVYSTTQHSRFRGNGRTMGGGGGWKHSRPPFTAITAS